MKTPREILLERHQAAAPKLDAIRQSVVAEELNNQAAKTQSGLAFFASSCLCCSNTLWRNLIWPSRRIWAGLAAIWILIFVANISMRDHSQITMAKSSPTPEMIMAWRQQERLLTELIGPTEARAAVPPRTILPQPSSQRRLEILTA